MSYKLCDRLIINQLRTTKVAFIYDSPSANDENTEGSFFKKQKLNFAAFKLQTSNFKLYSFFNALLYAAKHLSLANLWSTIGFG